MPLSSTLRRRALPVAGLAVAAAFATSTAASAAPGWTGASDIPESDTTGYGRLVVAPDGTTTAVWKEIIGTTRLRASVKPPGGVFGPPVDLATGSSMGSATHDVAVDDKGTVTVVWTQSMGDVPIVQVSRRPAGGSFSAPQSLSDPGATSDQLDVEAAGDTTAIAWRQADRARAALATGTGAFQMQNPVSKPGEKVDFPVAAVAPGGAALVAYRRYDANGFTLRASARKPGEPFAPLADVLKTATKEDVMHGVQAVMSPSGRATLAWQRGTPTSTGLKSYSLQSASRGASGDFGAPQTVSTSGSRADADFSLDVSADDTAVLVIPGPSNVRAAFRPLGGGFETPKAIPGSINSRDADVRFTKGGNAVAIWHEYVGLTSRISAAERVGDGAFGATRRLSPADVKVVEHSHRSSLAVDDEGSAMAWWVREAPRPEPNTSGLPIWRMQAAAYDAVAPAFERIAVPATARVGQSIALTALARDRWSGATVTWDLGDGSTEEGETLTYAYGAPGVHQVRFTATDGAGNARTETRTIQVTDVPGPRP